MKRFAVALAVTLAGCAPPTVWTKPGATTQDLTTDNYACDKDVRQSGGFDSGFLSGAMERKDFKDQCMAAHGWTAAQPAR